MTGDTAKISVVTTLYNAEQYLSATLDSILSQDYPAIELIAVLNGISEDSTERIVLDYAGRDGRVRPVYNRKEKSSIGEGLEAGLAALTGEYFTIIDGDDMLLPGALRELAACALRDRADIVIGNIVRMTMEGIIEGDVGMPDFSCIGNAEYLNRSVWYMDFLYHGKLYRSELLTKRKITFLPVLVGMDMLLHYQFVLGADRISRCTKKVHAYRINTDSTTRTMTLLKLQESFGCHQFLDSLFEESGVYRDPEVMYGFKAQGLVLVAGCLLQGGKSFYREHADAVRHLLGDDIFGSSKVRAYLKGWPVYYAVLSVCRLNMDIGNVFCSVLNRIRSGKLRLQFRGVK
ncbi:MAG: glycosyltransferase family 2 protein [Chlorobiaceae bacterium]|nr:glycosyltransferase family 2 protein [Chlorobiaceae bacterium]